MMTLAVSTGLRCRHCKEPARFGGSAGLPEEERKAVHTATGGEACADGGGRLAAPIDPDMARAS
jgi:hypothetical protein